MTLSGHVSADLIPVTYYCGAGQHPWIVGVDPRDYEERLFHEPCSNLDCPDHQPQPVED